MNDQFPATQQSGADKDRHEEFPDPQQAIEALMENPIAAKLDPDVLQYLVELLQLRGLPPFDLPVQQMRVEGRPPCSLDTSGHARVTNRACRSQDDVDIPLRVYHPDPAKHGSGPYPAHLNFHGGGFVLGDLDSDGALCLSMREAGVVVVDVNYRHCPETIWGKCILDAWDVLKWVRDSAASLNINPASISIGGISAGGHICLVLQHMARDAGVPLKLCMASVPPATEGLSYKDYTDSPFSSFHEFARGPILPWKRIKYFGQLCMPQDKLPELRNMWPDWWFAPLSAPNWAGLCDTFIRTAEVDPLRDEGEAYAVKLVAGGNKVTIKRYLGCPHTFMYIDALKKKQEYDRDAILALKIAHGIV